MSPKKAWAKFASMLLRAPDGAAFVVGISWDERKGWRPYQSIGTAILQMDTATARGLVASAYRCQSNPAFNELKPLFDDLAKICDEADQKNRDRVIPDGAAGQLPAQGSA